MSGVVEHQQHNNTATMVAAIERGDTAAEKWLAERFERVLRPRLYAMTIDKERQADLFQEAFLCVLLRLREGRLKDPRKLDGYISRTALFLLYADIRRTSRLSLMADSDELGERAAILPDAMEQIEQTELRHSLQDAVGKLRMTRDRQLLSLAGFDERPKTQVCAVLELSNAHYDRVIHRARARAKKILLDEHAVVVREWVTVDAGENQEAHLV
ncbi:MAG: sigma-70 family RNA polymerase sigma factor [Pseudomonadota bacterium]